MSHASVRYALSAAVAGPLMAVLLGGCIYHEKTTEKTVPAPAPAVVVAPSGDRVVNYPDGRYQLYGDGKIVPYYWVWIPSGTTPPIPPAPPRLP